MVRFCLAVSIFLMIPLLLFSQGHGQQAGGFSVTATADPGEICSGESVQLDVVVEGGLGSYAYIWNSIPPGFYTTLKNPVVKPLENTSYIVKASDGSNTGYDTVNVMVYEHPVVSIGEDTLICSGEEIILDPGTGFSTYLWQDGSAEPVYTTSKSGLYWVEVSNQYGCTGRDSLFLTVLEPPAKPAKPAGPSYLDLYTGITSSYTTTVTPEGISYEWSLFPATAGQIDSAHQSAFITWDTTYAGQASLSVRTGNICSHSPWSDSLLINIVNTTGIRENEKLPEIDIYPNPGRGMINIDVRTEKDMNISIFIYDKASREVYRAENIRTHGQHVFRLQLDQHPAGIYTVCVKSISGNINRKLILAE